VPKGKTQFAPREPQGAPVPQGRPRAAGVSRKGEAIRQARFRALSDHLKPGAAMPMYIVVDAGWDQRAEARVIRAELD
jgi:hypothetical protein